MNKDNIKPETNIEQATDKEALFTLLKDVYEIKYPKRIRVLKSMLKHLRNKFENADFLLWFVADLLMQIEQEKKEVS